MSNIGIYLLKDTDTQEIRYVGKSIHLSLRSIIHFQPCIYEKSPYPLYNWIRKRMRTGLGPAIEILQSFDSISDEDLSACEIYWIDKFKKDGNRLLNATPGGEGVSGRKWLKKDYELMCRKIISSDGMTYNSITEASKSLGVTQSSISQNLSGKSFSSANLSFKYLEDYKLDGILPITPKVPKNLPKQICDQNGQIYPTLSAAAKQLNLNLGHIGEVLKGKRRQVKGYVFAYGSEAPTIRERKYRSNY